MFNRLGLKEKRTAKKHTEKFSRGGLQYDIIPINQGGCLLYVPQTITSPERYNSTLTAVKSHIIGPAPLLHFIKKTSR